MHFECAVSAVGLARGFAWQGSVSAADRTI
jgi:hypothetical protein